MPLLAVPNVSEGRDAKVITRLETAFGRGVAMLDRHTDADHNRSVFTLAGEPGPLREALIAGAGTAIEAINISAHSGLHPRIGVLDVCPVVWIGPEDREVARREAISVATQIAGLGVPVFFYGEMARNPTRTERAYFREGGPADVWRRMEDGGLRPDLGPHLPHPTAGSTLVTARPPLAAFNVELDGGDIEVARKVAAALRESGGGLPGVRAIGLLLSSGRAQVSTNIHNPIAVPLAAVVERVRELAAPHGARPLEAELVGLVPAAAVEDYPEDVPIRDFDRDRQLIECRIAAIS